MMTRAAVAVSCLALMTVSSRVAAFSVGGVARPRLRAAAAEVCPRAATARAAFSARHALLRVSPHTRRTVPRMSLADVELDQMYSAVGEMEPDFLPQLGGLKAAEAGENATVMPLFPLGAVVYTPFSEHRLNIFEPRYRAMYNDILFSGARRFAVCTMHPEDGRLATHASVFYLKDLKEVSEQTNDAVKFVCDHEVIGTVRIKTILNPESFEKADTYLKGEVEYLEDSETDDAAASTAEAALKENYEQLVSLQHEILEDVKFTKDSVQNFNTTVGKGFWTTVEMWQVFQQQRLMAKQQEMQREFQTKLIQYLTKDSSTGGLPEVVNIADLPDELQQEVRALQSRMAEDLMPMQVRDGFDVQLLVQAKSHSDRLRILLGLVQNERRRLEAKKTLKSLFASE